MFFHFQQITLSSSLYSYAIMKRGCSQVIWPIVAHTVANWLNMTFEIVRVFVFFEIWLITDIIQLLVDMYGIVHVLLSVRLACSKLRGFLFLHRLYDFIWLPLLGGKRLTFVVLLPDFHPHLKF